MRPWLISLTCGIIAELLISFGLFISLYVTVIYSLGMWGFAAILGGIYAVAIIAGIIDAGYGINRKFGWVYAIKRLNSFKNH